jgi:hypothetical protein
MSVRPAVLALLEPICANAWAVELPHDPQWPAIVFDIDTQPEDQWCYGGGYDRHAVSVVILARTLGEIEALAAGVRAALDGHPQSLGVEDEGDADYERDPAVYAYYVAAVLRTPRY